MRKAALAAAILLAIVAVAAIASSLLGLQALRDALAERDGTRLAAVIDVDRLRVNVSARVRARYAQGAEVKLPIEPMVERLVTPDGLIAAICDGGVLAAGMQPPRSCDVHGSLGDLRFESQDRFSAALTQSGRVAATVVMDRAGLRWRLVDLVLPASAYDQLKNSVLN